MNSPITGKPMKLVKEAGSKLTFRKEEFEITYHYYLCEDSGEQFTNDELNSINQIQVHNKYREKYGIPFTEEIRAIRRKYNVSANKMSEILGMGANTYRLYEEGEIPSVSNGRLILAINDPEDFIKQVKASMHFLSEKELKKFIESASELRNLEESKIWDSLFTKHIFIHDRPCEFTGFSKPSFQKIAEIISYFSQHKEIFKTKLNKLLFYTDFSHYKNYGCSITGISYRAIPLGPVPASYDKLYEKLNDDQLIQKSTVQFPDGNYGEAISGTTILTESTFNNSEKATLETVKRNLLDLKTDAIVARSHEENAWINNSETRELISYQAFAFDLIYC